VRQKQTLLSRTTSAATYQPLWQLFLARWTDHIRRRLERDGEEIADEESFKPILHGRRSNAVVIRCMAGYSIEQVSNDIGMSVPGMSVPMGADIHGSIRDSWIKKRRRKTTSWCWKMPSRKSNARATGR
jgi:hypothetical protein